MIRSGSGRLSRRFQVPCPAHPRMEIEKMTDEADETFIRRLQFLANSLRRRDEPAVADDLEAVIRFKQSSPEEREEALWRDPWHLTRIKRLEKRAQQARDETQSRLANDLVVRLNRMHPP